MRGRASAPEHLDPKFSSRRSRRRPPPAGAPGPLRRRARGGHGPGGPRRARGRPRPPPSAGSAPTPIRVSSLRTARTRGYELRLLKETRHRQSRPGGAELGRTAGAGRRRWPKHGDAVPVVLAQAPRRVLAVVRRAGRRTGSRSRALGFRRRIRAGPAHALVVIGQPIRGRPGPRRRRTTTVRRGSRARLPGRCRATARTPGEHHLAVVLEDAGLAEPQRHEREGHGHASSSSSQRRGAALRGRLLRVVTPGGLALTGHRPRPERDGPRRGPGRRRTSGTPGAAAPSSPGRTPRM
jgi:hypothetical protein